MTDYVTKDSGKRAEFANGGVRDTEEGKPRFDLLLPLNVPYLDQLLTRAALLMGRGAKKYNDRNWEQFGDEAALQRAKSSALRHLMQLLNGEEDEDHAAAVVFNVMVFEYVKGVLAGEWKPLTGSVDQTLWTGDGGKEPPEHVKRVRDRVGDEAVRLDNGQWTWVLIGGETVRTDHEWFWITVADELVADGPFTEVRDA